MGSPTSCCCWIMWPCHARYAHYMTCSRLRVQSCSIDHIRHLHGWIPSWIWSRQDHVQAPQTLALGNMPSAGGPPGTLTKNASPLPSSLSRLTALTALALHDMTWEHSPDGLPDMPQVRCSSR